MNEHCTPVLEACGAFRFPGDAPLDPVFHRVQPLLDAPVVALRHPYVRLHGPSQQHLCTGSQSDDDLRWWAARCSKWLKLGHRVCAYFNNDSDGNAV